jgi:hypothetical protein
LKQEYSCIYLKEVTKPIRFLNKKAQRKAYKRGLDLLPEDLALKKYTIKKPSVQETRGISWQQFLTGVQRYLIGSKNYDFGGTRNNLVAFRKKSIRDERLGLEIHFYNLSSLANLRSRSFD